MTAPGNAFILLALTFSVLLSSAYAVGRIHQWHKHCDERAEAYRRGYDKASLSIFGMITRHGAARTEKVATVSPITARASTRSRGHRARGRVRPVDDRLQLCPPQRAEWNRSRI